MSIPINKENSITVLINSVQLGRKMGAYTLREASLLKQALDYFNPEVKEKPTFENSDNPEIVAVNLLLQGVQKAQAHGGEFAYSFDDADLLWKITEYWIKEGGKAVTQNVNTGIPSKEKNVKSAKAAASSVKAINKPEREEEDDDQEDDDEPTITVSKKGKERAYRDE